MRAQSRAGGSSRRPLDARPLYYADASALAKLVKEEPESTVLRRWVTGVRLISSELVLTEVPRAVRRNAAPGSTALIERVGDLLAGIPLEVIDRDTLIVAGTHFDPSLRSLDAIHVATALRLAPLAAFLTYDERQAAVANEVGLATLSPGVKG